MKDIQRIGQFPLGVFIISAIQMLLMIGFMLIFILLVLYVTQQYGFSDERAYSLSAAYNALIFAIPVIGGFLGSRYLGYHFGIIVSCILLIVGLTALATGIHSLLYFGLSCFIFGTGISVPSLYVLLGHLYRKDDPSRDSGFTLSYIGMNIGTMIATLSSGYLVQLFSFNDAFAFGALAEVAMLVMFLLSLPLIKKQQPQGASANFHTITKRKRAIGLLVTVVAIPVLSFLLNHATLSNSLMIALGIACLFLIFGLALKEDRKTRNRMFAFIILVLISLGFWVLYILVPAVVIIFIENNVTRTIAGVTIPTSDVATLNPFFILTLGPILSFAWLRFSKRGKVVSTSIKFATGVTLMGIGYLVLVLAIYDHNAHGYINFYWMVISYFFQTLGELFLVPVGFAMVGSLAPTKYEGMIMGIWQVATGIAGALSEFFARIAKTPANVTNPLATNHIYSHAFLIYGLGSLCVGLIAMYLVPKIQRISGHEDRVAMAVAAAH